jgi:hypothetical protein
MIKYRTGGFDKLIDEVEVERETKQFVLLKGEFALTNFKLGLL